MTLVSIAQHEVTVTPHGRWQRLNPTLGIDAFGVNAIICDPEERFDIEHDETDSGQQELYILLSGRARFRIGDDEHEAGPGDIVAVTDPALRRSYAALEPGTRILCIGAASGRADAAYGDWIVEAARDA